MVGCIVGVLMLDCGAGLEDVLSGLFGGEALDGLEGLEVALELSGKLGLREALGRLE